MTPEASAPIYQTLNATPLTLEEALCDKAKREIERFGVENALTRWRVICDYMHTEDWWPPAVAIVRFSTVQYQVTLKRHHNHGRG